MKSNPTSFFVEGVEEALCTDAPDAIWFVICGFAVVSVGLFVVAVSFRLLLQQKEVSGARIPIFESAGHRVKSTGCVRLNVLRFSCLVDHQSLFFAMVAVSFPAAAPNGRR